MAKTNSTKKAHWYNGNVKVGDMLTFNKLAGNVVLHGCMGSCGKHCTGCWNPEHWQESDCYVAKSYVQYGNMVIDSHIVNTEAMRKDPWKACEELNNQLKRKRTLKTVRQHSSGELETVEELKAWMWLASQNPERPFYVYTKAYEIVDKVLSTTEAKNLPKNYYINISVWHEHGIDCYNKWKHIPTVRAFAYDDGQYDYAKNGLKISAYCPAYKKNEKGKVKLSHDLTCDKCKLCFQAKAKVVGCLSH